MSRIDVLIPRFTKRRVRFSFGLRTLLLVTAGVSLLFGLWLRPRPYYVEALLHLESGFSSHLFDPERNASHLLYTRKYEEMFHSHLKLIESDKVLQAAISDPTLASISALRTQRDPVEWIQRNLRVSTAEDQVLSLRMNCTQYGARTCSRIIEAVISAYENEVTARQRRRMKNSAGRWNNPRTMVAQLQNNIRAKERLVKDGQDTQAITEEIERLSNAMIQMNENTPVYPRIRRISQRVVPRN